MGGLDGRALVSGDRLPVGSAPARVAARPARVALPLQASALVRSLRVMLGPQDAWFSPPVDRRAAARGVPRVDAVQSHGVPARGPPLAAARAEEPLSEPVPFGAMQVPAGGAPILLMADRQTAGGYPKIATVIAADLPLAGQLGPGDLVRFTACTRAEARAALIARERELLRA